MSPRALAPLAFLLSALAAPPAIAREPSELPAAPPLAAAPRGKMATEAVPEIRGPGNVTTLSNVWLKTTNIGVMGNPFPGYSADPAAQWPGPSGIEYLYYWSLWVGGVDPTAVLPEDRDRVSSAIEWRPPSLDPADRIYTTMDGTAGGFRGIDDDHDGAIDEDFLNGKDDDGDGRIDEDYAAISDRMFALEMRDDTPQSSLGTAAEPHRPLGLRVRQSVLSFGAPEAANFVAVQYEITNVGAHAIDSVYVGFLVDQDVGPVARQGYWQDDLPEPGIPSRVYNEELDPSDVRYDPGIDFEHLGGFCVRTSHRVRGFTMTDDDGDGGLTPGASCFFLLDHTTDTPFLGAPDEVGFRAFHLYRPGVPFAEGGAPTVDLERYRALSVPEGVSDGAPFVSRPAPNQKDDWSALASVGPFERLAPGQSVRVVVGFGVWPLDPAEPASLPADPSKPNPKRYAALFKGTEQAQLLYRGQFQVPPPGTPTPQARGRESYVVAPPDRDLDVADCHFNADSTDVPRHQPAGTAFWYNFNCDYCDAVKGQLRQPWVLPATPPSPRMTAVPGVHEVRLAWDNLGETIPDRSSSILEPERGQFSFWGYRIYRAAGYTRPVGTTGPADSEWELLAEFRRYDRYEPLVDSVDADGDGRFESTRQTADVLLDRATERRYPMLDVPPLKDSATGDTLFGRGVRTYFDQGCRCDRTLPDYRIPLYPIGRYGYVDSNVLNGFVYFYAVTALDSSGTAGVDGTTGSLILREGRKAAIEGDGIVPYARAARAGESGVFVVPNPYRGRAAWDLTPSPADPTGTHVDFYNMPRGAWILRVFTLAGDLVALIRNDDVQVNGRLQQESPDDGQASWNLISRNGQDVASGIYLFSVTSQEGTQRGKLVLIR